MIEGPSARSTDRLYLVSRIVALLVHANVAPTEAEEALPGSELHEMLQKHDASNKQKTSGFRAFIVGQCAMWA